MQEKNLISLIRKIKDIKYPNLESDFLKNILYLILPFFTIIFSLSMYFLKNNTDILLNFFFSFFISFMFTIFFALLLEHIQSINNYIVYKAFNSYIFKNLKVEFNKEEKKIIFNIVKKNINYLEENYILISVIHEQIENLDTHNLLEFLNIYKYINLKETHFKQLTTLLFKNTVQEGNLIHILFEQDKKNLSDKELIMHNFLKDNNDFLLKVIPFLKDSICKENSFTEIIMTQKLTKMLPIKYIFVKALESYSLKEITEALFSDNKNFILNDLLNTLDMEQLMLFKKNVIEKVLETKDENVIINCQEIFLKYAAKLDLKNKDLLCLMEEKCSTLNNIVIKENINIIHI